MRFTFIAFSLCTGLLTASPAMATGTLDCSAEDGDTAIEVHGIVPYGDFDTLVQVDARIATTLPPLASDLTRLTFAREHQVQFWFDDLSLNLMFYRERDGEGPFGATKLVIKTQLTDRDLGDTYSGTYLIKAEEVLEQNAEAKQRHTQGKIKCTVG